MRNLALGADNAFFDLHEIADAAIGADDTVGADIGIRPHRGALADIAVVDTAGVDLRALADDAVFDHVGIQ